MESNDKASPTAVTETSSAPEQSSEAQELLKSKKCRPKMKPEEIQKMYELHTNGKSIKFIATQLDRDPKTIRDKIKLMEENDGAIIRKASKRKISAEGDKLIRQWVQQDATITSGEIVKRYQTTFQVSISVFLVRKYLEGIHFSLVRKDKPAEKVCEEARNSLAEYISWILLRSNGSIEATVLFFGWATFDFFWRSTETKDGKVCSGPHTKQRKTHTYYLSMDGKHIGSFQKKNGKFKEDVFESFITELCANFSSSSTEIMLLDRSEYSDQFRTSISSAYKSKLIPASLKKSDPVEVILEGLPDRFRARGPQTIQDAIAALQDKNIIFGDQEDIDQKLFDVHRLNIIREEIQSLAGLQFLQPNSSAPPPSCADSVDDLVHQFLV